VHFGHALTGAAILLRHHHADEAVRRHLLIQRGGEFVLLRAVEPIAAVVLLGDAIAVIENLLLFGGEIEIHGQVPVKAARA
jgi:hypothetical protein